MLLRKMARILLTVAFLALGLPFSLNLAASGVSGATATARATPTAAQKSPDVPISISLVRRKVVMISGVENLQNAETAKPGDVLEDVATYSNKTSRTLVVPTATLPIPGDTELILNSIKPDKALASTDGVNFFAIPLSVSVKQANGVELAQPVPLAQYRFLRWLSVELAAKQSLVFSARFKVSDGTEKTIVKR